MSQQLKVFFKKHHFKRFSTASLIENILKDMNNGLKKDEDSPNKACQPMIPVYGLLPDQTKNDYCGKSAIIIDAGGTNFRSALVSFSEDGKPTISNMEKSSMPGIEKELSKDEFYSAIADKIEYLKDKADRIGFCFSYAMSMTKNNDGKVMVFSKEIKAPEVVGTFVGQELLAVLKKRGWKTIEKIVLLNDTVAALLAGIGQKTETQTRFSSYIGFVFGTGMNNAYIEENNIPKINDDGKKHIVVCESGMYNNILLSTFDELLDKDTVNPGDSLLEKMCSGGYLGTLTYIVIKTACEEHIFSPAFAESFKQLTSLKAADIDLYLDNPADTETVLGAIAAQGSAIDAKKLKDILTTVIKRTSSIVTAVLAATIIKSGKGKDHDSPIALVCNGSTFWKCHGLVENVEKSLDENLKGSSKAYYKILKIDDDISLGTALAAING